MFWTIVIIVVATYVVINILVYHLQERFLFKPEKLPEDFEFNYDQNFTEHNLDLGHGVNVNGVHFSLEKPRGVVFYLKGNSRSIKGWGKYAVDFNRLGFDVIMVDYRGFGKSTGSRTERGIKDDLQRVYDIIKSKVDQKYIIVYGRSMGSGFATKLASTNNPRMLILESPYYSMMKMASRYIPFLPGMVVRFTIRTYKWIQYVHCPIKIIHGTSDKLVPFRSSIKLSKLSPKFARLYPVVGGGHNDLHTFEDYHRMLEEIVNSEGLKEVDPNETSLNFKRKNV
ncbi:MAG: alpha/beta hydrolase [Cytophagales bacterium]|nr:alpha/beta hydrolase [Cytophagales bacterium]